MPACQREFEQSMSPKDGQGVLQAAGPQWRDVFSSQTSQGPPLNVGTKHILRLHHLPHGSRPSMPFHNWEDATSFTHSLIHTFLKQTPILCLAQERRDSALKGHGYRNQHDSSRQEGSDRGYTGEQRLAGVTGRRERCSRGGDSAGRHTEVWDSWACWGESVRGLRGEGS